MLLSYVECHQCFVDCCPCRYSWTRYLTFLSLKPITTPDYSELCLPHRPTACCEKIRIKKEHIFSLRTQEFKNTFPDLRSNVRVVVCTSLQRWEEKWFDSPKVLTTIFMINKKKSSQVSVWYFSLEWWDTKLRKLHIQESLPSWQSCPHSCDRTHQQEGTCFSKNFPLHGLRLRMDAMLYIKWPYIKT